MCLILRSSRNGLGGLHVANKADLENPCKVVPEAFGNCHLQTWAEIKRPKKLTRKLATAMDMHNEPRVGAGHPHMIKCPCIAGA